MGTFQFFIRDIVLYLKQTNLDSIYRLEHFRSAAYKRNAMTINDIARLSGVSKSTVSRYLTGGSVSQKSANKIAKAISDTGFVLNASASSLRSAKSNLVGVLVDGVLAPSVSKMLQGINSELHASGLQPFIAFYEHNESNKIAGLQALARQGVDAVLLGEAEVTDQHVQFLSSANIPTVILGQKSQSFPYCKVNDHKGGTLLAEHVVETLDTMKNCKRRVAYLSLPLFDKAAGLERWEGFSNVLESNSIEVLHIEAGYLADDGYIACKKALEHDVDFIVGASDSLCYGAWKCLDDQGYSVPRDILMAGFGNHDASDLPQVSLTSISFDYEALGRDAARKAVNLINGERIPLVNTDYPIRLVARNSTLANQHVTPPLPR